MNEPAGREPAPPIPGQPTPPIECSPWQRIIAHPKTTIAGILLCVVTIVPVLQAVEWAHINASSIIGLCGSLATALLGAMAKDN